MNSDSHKSEVKLSERVVLTSLNTFQPLSQRDLDALDSANQVPSSIPSLKSGLISPVAKSCIDMGRVESTALTEQNAANPSGEISQ